MNADVKTLWLATLRSKQITTKNGVVRRFKQGFGKLHRVHDDGSTGLCCLGVLTELAVEAGVLPPGELHETVADGCYYRYDNGRGFLNEPNVLPHAVVAWAGLGDSNPAIECREAPNGEAVTCLASLNDGEETFDVIADVIEAEL